MIPLHSQQVLSDRERDLRHRAEQERRLRTERVRDDPFGMDAEIRVLVERASHASACCDCEADLTQAAG